MPVTWKRTKGSTIIEGLLALLCQTFKWFLTLICNTPVRLQIFAKKFFFLIKALEIIKEKKSSFELKKENYHTDFYDERYIWGKQEIRLFKIQTLSKALDIQCNGNIKYQLLPPRLKLYQIHFSLIKLKKWRKNEKMPIFQGLSNRICFLSKKTTCSKVSVLVLKVSDFEMFMNFKKLLLHFWIFKYIHNHDGICSNPP